jgi:hypothetical protein
LQFWGIVIIGQSSRIAAEKEKSKSEEEEEATSDSKMKMEMKIRKYNKSRISEIRKWTLVHLTME